LLPAIRALEQGRWPIRGYITILQRVADALEAEPQDLDDAWLYMHTTPVQRDHDDALYDLRTTTVWGPHSRAGRGTPDAAGTAADGLAG
jgi:hypothetical protein